MTRLTKWTIGQAAGTAWLLGCCLHVWATPPDEAGRQNSPFEISAQRERIVRVTSHRSQYAIVMGGSVDMDNTTTRRYENFEVGFQPNISLEIANTGELPVVNPRLVINDQRKWWSLEEMLAEILAGARSDQEKALLIWDYVRKHRYHDLPLFSDDELHDPVRLLCIYGGGLCDDSAAVGCSLLYHAGLNQTRYARNPKTRHLHGHVMCEAYLESGYQFLDIDENVFYLDRENERIVSGDELARDHDLAKREHAFGPIFKGWQIGETAAALFGTDDGAGFRAVAGHRMDMTLRPGEKIVYRWDNVGKVASDGRLPQPKLRFFANSMQLYVPQLETFKQHATRARNVVPASPTASGAKLAGATRDAQLVYEMHSPYVACGGHVEAEFLGLHDDDRFAIDLSTDGGEWTELWSHMGKGKASCQLDVDQHLGLDRRPPKYRYFVRVSLASAELGSANLSRLALRTDLMAAPLSLPRLCLGRNKVVFRDETPDHGDGQKRHEVTITHRWQESANVCPPAAPGDPVVPGPDAVVRASTFAFQWPAVPDAEHYHIQVSRRRDMRLPFRPSFDVVVDRPSHGSPFTGMFSPDTDYYWRVRARNQAGVWGRWSKVRRFRWDGPRVPLNLKHHVQHNGEIMISWEPNPRGRPAQHYEVYGSDERGFSISKEPYDVKGLGRQSPNFVAQTTSTELLVVSPSADDPGRNRCYYRVVAVDANGVESGPSDYVELPHPYVFWPTEATAMVGQPLRLQLKTLRSMGDLQHRYADPTQRYWEREAYEFQLARAPAWLKLDPAAGVLTGMAAVDDVGTAEVEIVVKRRYPDEVQPSAERGELFQKTAPRFQATYRHRFQIQVLPQ